MANKIAFKGTEFAGSIKSACNVKFGSSNVEAALNDIFSNLGTWLPEATITAGETSIVLESDKITENSVIDIYYSNTSISVTEEAVAGSLTITLDSALSEALKIRIKVTNL